MELVDITTIRIIKSTYKEILKIMRHIQATTEEIPKIDETIQELLNNNKKKSEKKF